MNLFLTGGAIGFSIAMAIGPIGLLCIRNSVTKGFRHGLAIGLGAAVADGLYGAVAGFGVVAITTLLLGHKTVLQIIGGLFLCYLGLDIFRLKQVQERKEMTQEGCWSIFCVAFLLTMTNPMTILSFIGIYAGLGIGSGESTMISSALLTAGIFFGSAAWYLLLSAATSRFKSKLTPAGLHWLNRVSGCTIVGFGIAALVTA